MKITANRICTLLGPLLGALSTGLLLEFSVGRDAAVTAGVTLWCAIWWISEAVPIPVTSLLPLALFPLLGVLTPNEVGAAYGSPLILLLMGGFMLATALSRCGAHRRIALGMVNLFGGGSPRRLVFGFMAAAAFLSMWISNTATTLMLLPVALALLDKEDQHGLAIPLLLGVAFAASVGGLGTPIGTPPNLIFMQVYGEMVAEPPSFLGWMSIGIPVVLLMVPLMGFWLTRRLGSEAKLILPKVGTWQPEEKRTLFVFALTALAWITRREPFGGWSAWFDLPQANDASVALLAVVLMFLVPNGKGERLLDWNTAVRIPWGVLILFGGGIAIAKAFIASGLSEQLGGHLAQLGTLPLVLMVACICLAVTFLTEMTSNTATTTLLMPILAAAGVAAGLDPALLMVPAALSASCAFMLPVATAPNAIVFGSGKIPVRIMAREGLVLNLIGTVVITAVVVWRVG